MCYEVQNKFENIFRVTYKIQIFKNLFSIHFKNSVTDSKRFEQTSIKGSSFWLKQLSCLARCHSTTTSFSSEFLLLLHITNTERKKHVRFNWIVWEEIISSKMKPLFWIKLDWTKCKFCRTDSPSSTAWALYNICRKISWKKT